MDCNNLKVKDIGIKLDNVQIPGKFCNWYNNVIFEHRGRPYVALISIKAPGFSGKNEVSISMGNGPVRMKTESHKTLESIVKEDTGKSDAGQEEILVIEEPDLHVVNLNIKGDDAFRQTVSGDTITAKLGDTTSIECQVGKWHLKSKEGDFDVDLVFTARGPVVWWGEKPNADQKLTEHTIINGFEALSDVTGHITYQGEKMDARGRGVAEHVWIEKLDMMELRYVDWVVINFDQSYFMFYSGEGAVPPRSLAHYQTGSVCLAEDKKFWSITKIKVEHTKWAYSPVALRFIPISNTITLETSEGVLVCQVEPLISPTFVTIRRMENVSFYDIPGWAFYYWDAPYKATGTFTYSNGRVLKLTNGLGVNEPQRVSPLT